MDPLASRSTTMSSIRMTSIVASFPVARRSRATGPKECHVAIDGALGHV
jgi:hypothetical protein